MPVRWNGILISYTLVVFAVCYSPFAFYVNSTVARFYLELGEKMLLLSRFLVVMFAFSSGVLAFADMPKRPNVLWIVVDDMSPNFSCYGEKLISTPNVDRLAKEGTKFSSAYVTAPVCSPCRSALITGMYQTTIGAHHHRSGRGKLKIKLPEGVVPLPVLFKQQGYFTCIGSGLPGIGSNGLPSRREGKGKDDYNFEWDKAMYDSSDWAGRADGQPFFMQVQLPGGKLRGGSDDEAIALSQRAVREFGNHVDPENVELPPYYAKDSVLLRDWAAYLDAVRFTDKHVGEVLSRLERERILDETIVIFMTDHGISHARGKQFLYDEGTHVPLVVRGPGIPVGEVRSDLVEHIDVAAISLGGAAIAIPPSMQGKNVFSADYQRRDFVIAARDRCDETVDRIRSLRTDEFLYIRNYFPQRPMLQPNAYKDGKSIIQSIRRLNAAGELSDLGKRLLFAPERPSEELYLYREDTWQQRNLATEPAYQKVLTELRAKLDQWVSDTKDKGFEDEAMYDSDMAAYLEGKPEAVKGVVLGNINQMKEWALKGQ
jgi:arylsulfatase A-like enzyme